MRKLLAAALLTSALTVPAFAADGTLKIVSVDVEGGGGTLFVTPEGKSLLIDTGWPANYGLLPSPDGAKNSADRIAAAAKKLGLSKIDYADHHPLSHGPCRRRDGAGEAHAGRYLHRSRSECRTPAAGGEGRSAIAGRGAGQLYPKYLEAIERSKHIVAKPGQVIQIGSMTDTIVSSNGVVLSKPLSGAGAANPACDTAESKSSKDVGGEENRRSVASLLRFGKVSIALFGDLSWDKERELSCPVGKLGHVNLLIVTQHGSKISSNPASIADMHPDIALMGIGRQERRRRGPDQD